MIALLLAALLEVGSSSGPDMILGKDGRMVQRFPVAVSRVIQPYSECLWREFRRSPGLASADIAIHRRLNDQAAATCAAVRRTVAAEAGAVFEKERPEWGRKKRYREIESELVNLDSALVKLYLAICRPDLGSNPPLPNVSSEKRLFASKERACSPL